MISDKADARGLELAQERGIETLAIERVGVIAKNTSSEIIAACANVKWILFV